MLSDQAVQRLLDSARGIGPSMYAYIEHVLEPHAKINFRKAQGMLAFAKRFDISDQTITRDPEYFIHQEIP